MAIPSLVSIASYPEVAYIGLNIDFCRRDIDQMELTVEAGVMGNRNLVMQAMLLDPVIDSVYTAEKVFTEMMHVHADYLPQFA